MIEREIYKLAQIENGVVQNEKGRFCLGKEGRMAAKDAFDYLLGQAWPEDLIRTREDIKNILQTANDKAVKIFARSFLGRIDFRLREMEFFAQSQAVSPFRSAADIFRATKNFRVSEVNAEELTQRLIQRGLLTENSLRLDFEEVEQRIREDNERRRARLAAGSFLGGEGLRRRLNRRVLGLAAVILAAFLGAAGIKYSRQIQKPNFSVNWSEWLAKAIPTRTLPTEITPTPSAVPEPPETLPETGADAARRAEMAKRMNLKAGEEIILRGQVLDGLGYKFQAISPRQNGKFAVNEIVLGGDSLAGEGLTVLALHSGDYILEGQKITLPGGVLLANARRTTDTLIMEKNGQKVVFAYMGRFSFPQSGYLAVSQELVRYGLNLTDGKYLAVVTCDGWDEASRTFLKKTVLVFKQLPPLAVK